MTQNQTMSSTNDPFHALDNHDQGPPPLLNSDNRYRFNGKMMITAIVSLSVVIVLVIALHIYARCVLRRQARHRAALLQLGLTVAHTRSGREQQPRRGLDPVVIASLPVFVFKKRDVEVIDASSTAMECTVCLSTLENEDMARLLPNCKHIFHAECIDKWLSSHSTCPICRCEAMPEVHPESREAPAGPAGLETAAPTAPPLSRFANSGLSSCMAAGTSDGAGQSSDQKIMGSNSTSSRLNSFKRILSRDRSSARIHSGFIDQDDDGTVVDLEIRQ